MVDIEVITPEKIQSEYNYFLRKAWESIYVKWELKSTLSQFNAFIQDENKFSGGVDEQIEKATALYGRLLADISVRQDYAIIDLIRSYVINCPVFMNNRPGDDLNYEKKSNGEVWYAKLEKEYVPTRSLDIYLRDALNIADIIKDTAERYGVFLTKNSDLWSKILNFMFYYPTDPSDSLESKLLLSSNEEYLLPKLSREDYIQIRADLLKALWQLISYEEKIDNNSFQFLKDEIERHSESLSDEKKIDFGSFVLSNESRNVLDDMLINYLLAARFKKYEVTIIGYDQVRALHNAWRISLLAKYSQKLNTVEVDPIYSIITAIETNSLIRGVGDIEEPIVNINPNQEEIVPLVPEPETMRQPVQSVIEPQRGPITDDPLVITFLDEEPLIISNSAPKKKLQADDETDSMQTDDPLVITFSDEEGEMQVPALPVSDERSVVTEAEVSNGLSPFRRLQERVRNALVSFFRSPTQARIEELNRSIILNESEEPTVALIEPDSADDTLRISLEEIPQEDKEQSISAFIRQEIAKTRTLAEYLAWTYIFVNQDSMKQAFSPRTGINTWDDLVKESDPHAVIRNAGLGYTHLHWERKASIISDKIRILRNRNPEEMHYIIVEDGMGYVGVLYVPASEDESAEWRYGDPNSCMRIGAVSHSRNVGQVVSLPRMNRNELIHKHVSSVESIASNQSYTTVDTLDNNNSSRATAIGEETQFLDYEDYVNLLATRNHTSNRPTHVSAENAKYFIAAGLWGVFEGDPSLPLNSWVDRN